MSHDPLAIHLTLASPPNGGHVRGINPLFSCASRAPGGGIRHPAVAAILRGAEESRTNEIVEHRLADRAILASETFDLRRCKSHTGHLEELRANSFEDLFVGKFGHGPSHRSTADPEPSDAHAAVRRHLAVLACERRSNRSTADIQ
jgi:hypothetical protein